jgi:hypothetical protein
VPFVQLDFTELCHIALGSSFCEGGGDAISSFDAEGGCGKSLLYVYINLRVLTASQPRRKFICITLKDNLAK